MSTMRRQLSRIAAFFQADARPMFCRPRSASTARSHVWLGLPNGRFQSGGSPRITVASLVVDGKGAEEAPYPPPKGAWAGVLISHHHDSAVVRRWLQLRFDRNSTALRPFDDLRYDRAAPPRSN